MLDVFREASWDEALALAAGTLKRIRDEGGSRRWPASARPRVRTRKPTCSRSSCGRVSAPTTSTIARVFVTRRVVAAPSKGSGRAPSNPVMDVLQEVVLLIGANPVVNHPVAATWIKNAVKLGTKLILADPRRSELARHATHYLQFKPDTDVASNAMMHTIIEEGLVDQQFVRARRRIRRNSRQRRRLQPEAMAPICGSGGDDPRGRAPLRQIARLDDPVGHGHPQHARHRQRALPDRSRC